MTIYQNHELKCERLSTKLIQMYQRKYMKPQHHIIFFYFIIKWKTLFIFENSFKS